MEKGLHLLLKHWPEDRNLDIIGAGPLEDWVRRESALRRSVNFVGSLARAELLDRLGQYRALVVPSISTEGLPTVILEALARGVPSIISTSITAADVFERAGAAATFVPGADSRSLNRAISRLDADSAAMRVAATRLYSAQFSPDLWLRRVESLYSAVLSRLPAQ